MRVGYRFHGGAPLRREAALRRLDESITETKSKSHANQAYSEAQSAAAQPAGTQCFVVPGNAMHVRPPTQSGAALQGARHVQSVGNPMLRFAGSSRHSPVPGHESAVFPQGHEQIPVVP